MTYISTEVLRQQADDTPINHKRRKVLIFGILSALGGMSPMQAKAFLWLVVRFALRVLPRMARAGARVSRPRRLAVTSTSAATYSSRSSANRFIKPTSKSQLKKSKVRAEVNKTPNTTTKDRIELAENIIDVADLLTKYAENSKASEHLLRKWEHEGTDFSHIENCRICSEVYTSISHGTNLSGLHQHSHEEEYTTNVEEVIVIGERSYRPKKRVSDYVHCKLRGRSDKVCELIGDTSYYDPYKM